MPSRSGKFLAQNGVGGKAFGNQAAEFRLGRPIGRGDRRVVGLKFNGQVIVAKVPKRDIARRTGGVNGEVEAGGEVEHDERVQDSGFRD